MALRTIRDASQGHTELSKTTLIIILATVGSLILGLLVGLGMLLVRAIRMHKRLLADLEERGITVTPPFADTADPPTIARPPAVLRRTTFLPFNSKSGWGSLPSHETVVPPPLPSVPPHATDSKLSENCKQMSQLPWPFSGRRTFGGALHLKKLRAPQLIAINEITRGFIKTSPPLGPVSNGPGAENPSPVMDKCRLSSDQLLHKYYTVLRNNSTKSSQETASSAQPESSFSNPISKRRSSGGENDYRPNRLKSVAVIPMNTTFVQASRIQRPKVHSRSVSLCSQSSGYAPDAAVPPLPLGVARVKSEAIRRSPLARCPSRHSVSSFESVGSSILASQSSPMTLRSNSLKLKKANKRDWGNLLIAAPGPFRDQVTCHGQNNDYSENSIKNKTARNSMGSPCTKRHSRRESPISSSYGSSLRSTDKMRTAETIRLSRFSSSSPAGSNLAVQTMATPRRQSGTRVNLYGSPQGRRKVSILRDVSGRPGFPTRQLSQTSTQASSTRSSNGNPFQWDPTPLQSGKPSALKGSPSARKGHKRQNCVRISLAPTILGPPSRSPSPSIMNNIQEESPEASAQKVNIGLGFSTTRSLPRPPTASVFAPEIKLNRSTLRVSLTPSSPRLSPKDSRHNADGSPTLGHYNNPNATSLTCDSKRLRNSSIFSIPTFLDPYNDIDSIHNITSPTPTFAFSCPSNKYVEEIRTPEIPTATSSPLDATGAHSTTCSSQQSEVTTVANEYDRQPSVDLSHPDNKSPSHCSSAFTAAQTNSSTFPCGNREYAQSPPYSPPCSPKTLRPRSFAPVSPVRLSITAASAPIASSRELHNGTANPAILSTNVLRVSNGLVSNSTKIYSSSGNNKTDVSVPLTPATASTLFEPLLEAAFPSRPRTWFTAPKSSTADKLPGSLPTSGARSHRSSKSAYQPLELHPSVQSNAGVQVIPSPSPIHTPSLPSHPSDPPSPVQTPTLSSSPVKALSALSDIPTPSPTLIGPRASPPRDLRRTIAALRRMNSDIKGDNKGDRRYLHLGLEASLALPGDESWTSPAESAAEGEETTFTALDDWEEKVEKALVSDLIAEIDEKVQHVDNAKDEYNKGEARNLSHLPSSSNTEVCSSSIWEEGKKFWASTPSPPSAFPTIAPTIIKDTIGPHVLNTFQVGKTAQGSKGADGIGHDRRRNALAFSINVQPPSNQGTPRSLYDAEGFLRG